ncbi:MAG TPA: YaaL family protein [Massilibacterium sp.]|nr:YaaL family protein [Massilibacterium sp.]
MLFSKRKKLRQQTDEKLLQMLAVYNEKRKAQEKLYHHAIVESSTELLYDLKLTEAKYFFLLKEAKVRNISMK